MSKNIFDFCKDGNVKAIEDRMSDDNINLVDKKTNATCLMIASYHGHIPLVKLLCTHPQIDINAPNNSGETALHGAASQGQIEVIEILCMQPKVNINATTNNNETPLHYTIFHGQPDAAKLLLEYPGIEVNILDTSVNTPLLLAVNEAMLSAFSDLCMNKGTNLTLENAQNRSPLEETESMNRDVMRAILITRLEGISLPGEIKNASFKDMLRSQDIDINHKLRLLKLAIKTEWFNTIYNLEQGSKSWIDLLASVVTHEMANFNVIYKTAISDNSYPYISDSLSNLIESFLYETTNTTEAVSDIEILENMYSTMGNTLNIDQITE